MLARLRDLVRRPLGAKREAIVPTARFVKDLGVDPVGNVVAVLRSRSCGLCIMPTMQAGQT